MEIFTRLQVRNPKYDEVFFPPNIHHVDYVLLRRAQPRTGCSLKPCSSRSFPHVIFSVYRTKPEPTQTFGEPTQTYGVNSIIQVKDPASSLDITPHCCSLPVLDVIEQFRTIVQQTTQASMEVT